MELLDALIQIESSGNPMAFNPKSGARGLTQITPVAWKDLVAHYPQKYSDYEYEEDIFDPQVAKEAARDYIKVITGYLKHYKLPVTTENILASYNFGIGNVKDKKPYPAETQNYIRKIIQLMGK